jgi:Fe-S-cluster containining protein
MVLLEKINVKIHSIPCVDAGLSEEEIGKYSQAREDFSRMLKPSLSGKALISEIYRVQDRLNLEYRKGNAVACGAKCAYCCRQLVCCTTLEMELIVDHLRAIPRPRRREIVRVAKKKAIDFYTKNSGWMNNALKWEDVAGMLRRKLHLVPCIFLKNGNCSIYPVRPVDCRIAKTAKPCGHEKNLESLPEGIRLFCDQVASDMIMDEENRCFGALQVVPLIGWPISDRFIGFFT